MSVEVFLQQVLNFVMKEKEANASHKPINKPKNRTLDLVPVDNYRVHLTPKPGEDGSDYINASWIQGFCSLREFIITQHPMKSTINDFWQMVWDHSAQTIVMISIIDNQVRSSINRFLQLGTNTIGYRISKYFGPSRTNASKWMLSG